MQINEGLLGARARAGLRMLIAAVATAVLAQAPANASSFKVLHSFCKKLYCGDGYGPQQALTIDQAGNLYGTASGGAHNSGIVFELVSPTTGKRWQYRVLYHFCALSNCADGGNPEGSTLVVDTAGNVYGTTYGGGAGNGTGTIFELSPPVKGHHWSLHTIYTFCVAVSSCRDGENPSGGLTYAGRGAGLSYDGASPLFGVTASGGRHFGGVAYSLVPKAGSRWLEHVLYAFCATGGQSCTDGVSPVERLTMDASGNFYGTTTGGGTNIAGVAFKLAPLNGQNRLTESVLYNFCAECDNAGGTSSGLVEDLSGNLLGASDIGGTGANCPFSNTCGLIYRISADGSEGTVYTFCSLLDCGDGSEPIDQGGLFIDGAGDLFGTTLAGGGRDRGTLFKLTGSTVQVLHSFCSSGASCLDGARPRSGVIADLSGRLFGTTFFGGAYDTGGGGGGTVFELTP